MKELESLNAFAGLSDPRGSNGKQHKQTLCIGIFTLAVVAGCRGLNAMGDWVKGYHDDLVALFEPRKDRLPSYSTLRRVMLGIDYQAYGACLSSFFEVTPQAGETVAIDGKVLRGSYEVGAVDGRAPSHPAIQLVISYIVERGLILESIAVDCKSNEITALPLVVKRLAEQGVKGVVFAFDALNTPKKLCRQIIQSENHYLAPLKYNHRKRRTTVEAAFSAQEQYSETVKSHGRIDHRTISIGHSCEGVEDWPGVRTFVRIESQRNVLKGGKYIVNKPFVRFFITSLNESAAELAARIRAYWHVENKVHYCRDVSQGEDASRIRTGMLPHCMSAARDCALNAYRAAGCSNMAKAARDCSYNFSYLLSLINLK